MAMHSSLTDGSYALQSNLNRVFFGKSPSTELSLIPSAQSSPVDLLNLMFDSNGDLYTLNVDASPVYTATAYPTGFVKDATGTLRSAHISKRRVTTESDLQQSDASFGSALVPIFVGQSTMQFYVMDSASDTIFKDQHLGYQVSQKSGGSAYIKKISPNGKLIEAIIQVKFNPESVSQSPAILSTLSVDTLSVSDLGDVTAPLVTLPGLTSVTLRLTNIVAGGWLLSDVGKSVIFNYGSIYIASVTSSTTATGLIISKPLASTSALPGFWSMFDFRASNNYALTLDQTLTVSVAAGGLASCTLSSGLFAFNYARKICFNFSNGYPYRN
jgi:hypothetical protein